MSGWVVGWLGVEYRVARTVGLLYQCIFRFS